MQTKSGVVYVTTKQFDAYYCGCGRVTVNPGAMFCLEGNRVYFVNSKNYLPYEATNDFKNSFFSYYSKNQKEDGNVKEKEDDLFSER